MRALLPSAVPGISEDDIKAAVERRMNPTVMETLASPMLHGDKLAAGAEDLIDEDDVTDVHEQLVQAETAKR